jgi:hypothetical protein
MTRAQALKRLQAVCDKKGWQRLQLWNIGCDWFLAVRHEPWVTPIQMNAPTLAALVDAFEERANQK